MKTMNKSNPVAINLQKKASLLAALQKDLKKRGPVERALSNEDLLGAQEEIHARVAEVKANAVQAGHKEPTMDEALKMVYVLVKKGSTAGAKAPLASKGLKGVGWAAEALGFGPKLSQKAMTLEDQSLLLRAMEVVMDVHEMSDDLSKRTKGITQDILVEVVKDLDKVSWDKKFGLSYLEGFDNEPLSVKERLAVLDAYKRVLREKAEKIGFKLIFGEPKSLENSINQRKNDAKGFTSLLPNELDRFAALVDRK